MTQFAFLPSVTSVFQFQPKLDGDLYSASTPWNLSGQRYYFSLFALDGTRILTLPLIGSRDANQLQSLVWKHGFVSATTVLPHEYVVGKTINLLISGNAPDGYNGSVKALVTGRFSFQYPLASDPGPAVEFGISDYIIDLVAGYFTTSRLVFRASNATFEVTP